MVGENAVDAKTLQSITTGLGHSLKIVKNGTEALKIGESRHFDLILLDIFLPDMKGYELIPEFKKKWPETIGVVECEWPAGRMEQRFFKIFRRAGCRCRGTSGDQDSGGPAHRGHARH